MPGLTELLFGRGEEMQQAPTMNPQQMQLLEQLLGGLSGATGGGLGFLQQLLGGDTEQFTQPLMRHFQESVIPGIAERFSGMGAGAQQSSAFTQQLSQAGAGLEEQLGSLRGQLQMGGLGQLSQLLGMGLGARTQENIFRPATTGLFGQLAGGAGTFLGNLPFMFGR